MLEPDERSADDTLDLDEALDFDDVSEGGTSGDVENSGGDTAGADTDEAPISGVNAVSSASSDEDGDEDEDADEEDRPARAAAPEISAGELVGHLRSGARITCEIGDFDALDTYELSLAEVGPGVRFSYPDGSMVHVVEVTEQSIESATQVIHISQGSIDPSPDQTPPFLLARSLLARLKSGESISLTVYGTTYSPRLDGTRTVKLTVNGQERSVNVLRAKDKATGVDIDVLDHATWPVLLGFDNGDEVSIRLLAIDTR